MRLQPLFRDLNSGSRILMLVMIIILSGILSLSVSYLISVLIWGKDVLTQSGNPELMNLNFMRFTQMLNQIGFFLLPPFFFVWLSEQKPTSFLGFFKPRLSHIIAATLLLVVAGPFIDFLAVWNEKLVLPPQLSGIADWMISSEDAADKLTRRMLNAPGTLSLVINVLMIGLLPALGEELLFRSALIGLFRKVFRSIHLPVIIAAFLFSALHLQFFGFLPRFILGLAFGYLFVWSGSIWIPVIAHFLNNTSIVVATFLFNNGMTSVTADEISAPDTALWVILSFISSALIMFMVYQTRKITLRNRNIEVENP